MKTTIRSNRAAIAIFEIAALLCLTFVLTGCNKKEAVPSAEKALVRTPVVESRENVRSDSEASYLAQVRAEKWPEPQRDRADNGEQAMAIENRTEIAALEREERLLVEAIITAKAAETKAETTRVIALQVRCAWSDLRTAQSVLTAQSENIKKAERALELATSRYEAGTGTQIDVLNAQTALTEARGSYDRCAAQLLRGTRHPGPRPWRRSRTTETLTPTNENNVPTP